MATEDTSDKLSLYVSGVERTLATGQAVTDLFDGATHHLALTWDSVTGKVNVYVDGTQIGTEQTFATGSVATGGAFTLGQRIEDVSAADYQTAGEIFEGIIYEVRVYDDLSRDGRPR